MASTQTALFFKLPLEVRQMTYGMLVTTAPKSILWVESRLTYPKYCVPTAVQLACRDLTDELDNYLPIFNRKFGHEHTTITYRRPSSLHFSYFEDADLHLVKDLLIRATPYDQASGVANSEDHQSLMANAAVNVSLRYYQTLTRKSTQ